MKKVKLYVLSFDGECVCDSEHDTLEQANEKASDLGSKWFFYPWPVMVRGKTIVDIGGVFFNRKTNTPILYELFKGKRFNTIQKIFKKFSEKEEMQNVNVETFEEFIIDNLR